MYNRDILDALIKEFGVEKTILYCRMESRKSDLLYQDAVNRGFIGSCELEYDRDWWNDEGNLLQTLNNNKNGNNQIIRRFSKSDNSDKAMVPGQIIREFKG